MTFKSSRTALTRTTSRIDFANNTSFFSADWWTIPANTIYVEAFNSSDVTQGFVASNGTDGTVNINGDIAYITWHNNGGFVQLANIRYDGVVPIPAAVWLFGSGLLGLIGIARRKKA